LSPSYPLVYLLLIETKSELSAGQTVVDVWQQSGLPANVRFLPPYFIVTQICLQVHIADKVDVPKFWALMVAAWTKADATSFLNK